MLANSMNKKVGLLLILVLGSFLIAAIIYYVFYFSVNKTVPKVVDEVKSTSQVLDASKTIKSPKVEAVETKKPTIVKQDVPLGQASLERMARSFAERFGSFSNHSNFSNVEDLKMVMSTSMQAWADSYIKKNRKSNLASEIYYGLTTKSLSTDVKKFDDLDGKAVIAVETRRREATGTTNNASKLFNQEILITFVKEDQAWKVDSAYWQD